ncbi:MAG TPA: TolC family protein [Candidatus Hydrogenedentes bacterium]|jgi:outer membrane protein TolC|nr:TolC family protein [Candidatus Hydrogenedentota bacterium]
MVLRFASIVCMVFAAFIAGAAETGVLVESDSGGVNALISSAPMQGTMNAIEAYLSQHEDLVEQPAGGEALSLSVRKCVDLALANNEKIFQAEKDIDAARARIGQARSQMLPQLGASLTFVHTEFNERNPGGLFAKLGGGSGGGFISTGDPATSILLNILGSVTQNYLATRLAPQTQPGDNLRIETVTADQVLYAGGRIQAAISAAELLAESQEWQKAVTLAQVEYDAKQGFYDVLLVASLVEVAADSVRTFERNLTDAQQMFEVGTISNFEVLRAKTELGARKSELVAAKNALRLTEANLRRVLFVPENTRLQLDPSIEWQPADVPVSDYVARAVENRPELAALRKAIQAGEQQVKAAKGQYLPTVGLRAQYSNTDEGGLVTPDGWTFSLGAQYDIYTGGKRKYDMLEARARVAGLEHQLADLERLVELDVTQAHINIQDAMAKMESERGNVTLAQEGLRLAELRFQEGVGTQSEILDAELALTNAQSSLFQSLREYAVANAALERATGNSWWRGKEEFSQSLPVSEEAGAELDNGDE